MITLDCEQMSQEWFDARCGIPSASKFNNIITSTGLKSKQRKKYMYTLAGERLLGHKEDTYQSRDMLIGIEREKQAREMYNFITDNQTEEVGLCYRDEEKLYSCSPDFLSGGDGAGEIKSPKLSTYVEYILRGRTPTVYYPQVQGQLFITGREWCDFIVFYPGMELFIYREYPNIEFHKKLEDMLNEFCEELDDLTHKLEAM